MENQTVYTEQFRGKSSSYFLDLKTSEKAGYYLVLSQSSKDKEKEGENQFFRHGFRCFRYGGLVIEVFFHSVYPSRREKTIFSKFQIQSK